MFTLTSWETPQRLAAIMRDAWRINRNRARDRIARALRLAWALARRRAGRRLPPRPRSLLQWLRARGLRPCPELRHAGVPLAYLWRRGLTLDDAARIATDAGYDCRDDTWRLISMIRDELFGFARHVAAQDAAIDLELDEWQRAHEIIMSDDCPF